MIDGSYVHRAKVYLEYGLKFINENINASDSLTGS